MTGRSLTSELAVAGMMLGTALAAPAAQAHPTLQFVDVTRAQGSGYRVTSVSNYRIGIITPIRANLAEVHAANIAAARNANLSASRTTSLSATRGTSLSGTRRSTLAAAHAAHLASSRSSPTPSLASDDGETLPGYLQCVPYARQVSGIQLFGDARSWWTQAAGRYSRGNTPRAGAVMAFRPHGRMTLGHVAAVSRVLDSRRVLLRHANWSPISGRRGQVERDVLAQDVSPGNDWSEVRVWYDPIHGLGTTHWPVSGFIYAGRSAQAVHGLAGNRWTSDPIGAIIAAFSGK